MTRELTAKEITEIVDSGILDDEIIRAFQICSSEHLGCEDNCPFNERCSKDPNALDNAVLDLINRQKAEIERLNGCVKTEDEVRTIAKETIDGQIKLIKSEAIKEFWSKLKTHTRKMKSSDFSGEFWDKAILVEDGDNLVKETVGE